MKTRKRGTAPKVKKVKTKPEAISAAITNAIEDNVRRYEHRQADRSDRTDVTAYRRMVKQQ